MDSVSWAGAALVGLPAAFLLYRRARKTESKDYLEIARRKRLLRDAAVQECAGLKFPPSEKQTVIANSTVCELKRGLETGMYTSEEILLTFIRRTIDIGLPLFAVADVCFTEALAQARLCDQKRREGTATGLLFGIPISVKDVFHIKGMDSTCGMTAYCFLPQEEDGLSIELLKKEGAIPFVKTNVPFGVISLESGNRIWGNTQNPWNRGRTAGGSSGGEVALIASRCSALGLANDFGGSIRYPSSVTGLYGFMCTGERGSAHGAHRVSRPNGAQYLPYAWSRTGPIARSVDDLVLMLKALWSPAAFQRDRLIPKLPFNDELYESKKQVVVAVVENSLWELPVAVKRAIREAVEALRAAGYTVVKADIDITEVAMNLFQLLTSGDAWAKIGQVKGSEPWLPDAQQKVTMLNLPHFLKRLIYLFLSLAGSSKISSILSKCQTCSAYSLMEILSQRTEIVRKVIRKLQELGAEAVIMPAAITPAPELGKTDRCELANVHIFAAAHLTLPTGVVPVTLVRPDEEGYEADRGDLVGAAISAAVSNSRGLPVSVQVSALPFQDETCLRVMRDLERGLHFSAKPNIS